MSRLAIERRLLLFIAVVTLLTGAAQMALPERLLSILSAESTRTSAHFFATVGMFMVVIGGALLQALRTARPVPIVVFWTGWQKLGAAALVALGIGKGVLAPLAGWVAGFDLASGLLAFHYWKAIR